MAKSIQVEHLLEDFEYQGHEYEVLVELDVVDDTIQLSELIEVHDNDTDMNLDETDMPDDFTHAVEKAIAELELTDLDIDWDKEED